jgi:hypothetical protein
MPKYGQSAMFWAVSGTRSASPQGPIEPCRACLIADFANTTIRAAYIPRYAICAADNVPNDEDLSNIWSDLATPQVPGRGGFG